MYTTKFKEFLNKIKHIEGDILEIGTFKGNTTKIICEFIIENKLNKKIYSIDTFKGYTDRDLTHSVPEYDLNHLERAKSHVKSKRWNHSKSIVESQLSQYKGICTIWEGDSVKTLPKYIKESSISQISFLFVDCNMYLPSISSMELIYPLIPTGGIIAIDEHWLQVYKKFGGESKALFEFAKKTNLTPLEYGKSPISPSHYIIKK